MGYTMRTEDRICEYEFCIYNKKYACQLERIEINARGQCRYAEPIGIDYDYLEAKKECERQERKVREAAQKEQA